MQEINNAIETLKTKYPGIKIILCELTPRKDDRDTAVIECNKLISTLCAEDETLFLVEHNNLRDENYSKLYDTKHIHKRVIPLFASNIKRALRKAYGIKLNKGKNVIHSNSLQLSSDSPHYLYNLRDCLMKLPMMQRKRIIEEVNIN